MTDLLQAKKWRQSLTETSRKQLSVSLWRRRLFFWGGGLLTGLVAVLFTLLCNYCDQHFSQFAHEHPYYPFLVTPFGLVLIMLIVIKFFPGSESSGIPQVIAAIQISDPSKRRKLVSLKIAFAKFFLTAMGFLTGASIGREGPTIQLAAAIMNSLRRFAKFKTLDLQKGFLLAGGAAGIAAAFNAPLAGIMFAIEELSSSFNKALSGVLITTVVLSGIVAQSILGNYAYFGISPATLNLVHGGWWPMLVTAIIGGACGGLFSSIILKFSLLLRPLNLRQRLYIVFLLGLLIAGLGFISHGLTYGSGYNSAKELIDGDGQVSWWYGPAKMLATILTFLTGIPGGIFAPSLSAGAGFGGLISYFFAPGFKDAVIILGTVAYFSGVVQSPITCFVIVLEMTSSANSSLVLPIMLTSLIATAVSRGICRKSLYHVLAERYLDAAEVQASSK